MRWVDKIVAKPKKNARRYLIFTRLQICVLFGSTLESKDGNQTRGVLRQTGVRRREMMRLRDIGDKHSLIRSLEAVNSWVASHQGRNWFSCQRVNYPAAIYSFRASPGRIPSPCHSCLMSNTVYTFHTTSLLLLVVVMMMKVMMVIFGSSSQFFFPSSHTELVLSYAAHRRIWFAYARTNSNLPPPRPSEATVNQHRFLKGWN